MYNPNSLETLAQGIVDTLEREDHQDKEESIKVKSTGLANALHKILHKIKGGE